MAILNPDGFPEKGGKGEVTIYQRNGQTIVRVKHRSKSNHERTTLVMNQRTRWSNVQRAWAYFRQHVDTFFDDRKAGQTAYNKFMSVNMPHAIVYMPKDSRGNGCVLDHFTLSSGVLRPAVSVKSTPQGHVSSLTIGDLQVDESTTVTQFILSLGGLPSECTVAGYNLHFFRVNQDVWVDGQHPSLSVRHWHFEANIRDQRPLMAVLGITSVEDGLLNIDGHLGAVQREGSLVAWVVTLPTDDGRVLATTQRLEGDNPLLARYSSKGARYEAIYSYGDVRPSNKLIGTKEDRNNLPQYTPQPIGTESYNTSAFNISVNALAKPTPAAGTIEGMGTFPLGTSITLKAVAAEGYRFLCWDDGCLEAERTLQPSDDITLAAIFAPLER